MKLLRLQVADFAAIANAEIEFGPGLNVLYGPNDLGKSTLDTRPDDRIEPGIHDHSSGCFRRVARARETRVRTPEEEMPRISPISSSERSRW